MTTVKVFGAGSAGNHLTHAARRLGWEVTVCDVDPAALERMRTDIYPGRYGSWDDSIGLCELKDAPAGGFDAIFIATPPDRHVEAALSAVKEEPKVLVIEKPLCRPSYEDLDEIASLGAHLDVDVLVGYDHTVGRAARYATDLLQEGAIGEVRAMDVEFREHWAGIFAAHPWLSGPGDSYLGSWKRGGGAGGEHSHGINLWQYFAHCVGAGRVSHVDARVSYEKSDTDVYDTIWFAHLETETGLLGRVAQDVVTRPPRKRAFIQGTEGFLEWICGYSSTGDAVLLHRLGHETEQRTIEKTRSDDFLEEVLVVDEYLKGNRDVAALRLERAVETMLVLTAGHESERTGSRVEIEYGSYSSGARGVMEPGESA